jgi:hypothetical protein
MEQLGDLVDMHVHSPCGSIRIAPAQRSDDRFVALNRALGTSLLLQRQRSRLDEQVVQGFHDAHHRPVARRAREHGMKRGVFDDGGAAGFELAALGVDDALQVGEVVFGDTQRGSAGDGRLEHAADVEELVAQIVPVGEDRRQRRDQPVDVELTRKRPLTVTRFEQADGFEHAQRVADGATADAEAGCQEALARKRAAGGKGPVENQDADTIGDFLGHARLFDRLEEPGRTVRGAVPRERPRLDSLHGGCQTARLNWSDHWASVAQSVATEFIVKGPARMVSRAIEQYAQAQGHVSAIVVPWEGSAGTLRMSVTSVRADGWAIEHTNLGTITLNDREDGQTAVVVSADDPDHADKARLIAVFDRFAEQLQRQFEAAP